MMLFSEKEIDNLHIFRSTANNLNSSFFLLKDFSIALNYNDSYILTNDIFVDIKEKIIYLDNFLKIHTTNIDFLIENVNDFSSRMSSQSDPSWSGKIQSFFIIINKIYLFVVSILYDNGRRPNLYIKAASDDQVFMDFYSRLKSIVENIIPDAKKHESNYFLHRLAFVEDQVNSLEKSINFQNGVLIDEIHKFLEPQKDNFIKEANNTILTLQNELAKLNANFTVSFTEQSKKLNDSLKSVSLDFQATYKDYQVLKKMVNAKGEQQITDHYKKRAFWERITYWLMTIGTFAIIIWSICLALNGLDEYKAKTNISISSMVQQYKEQPVEKIEKMYSVIQSNALTYLVLRLIFSVLLFSSIIYTSRVAYRAYVHMRHSENMMLKLATLRPFINQLEEEDRNQIHKDLVPDYFGKDAGMVDSTNEKFKDLPANVSAVAMKAIEQISGNSNSPSTEKNSRKLEGETG